MNILVTGAAGFIGSQLAYRLWKDNEDIVILDNFSYGHEDNLIFPEHDFNGDIIRIDIRDKYEIEKIFSEGSVDYVYNIAGINVLKSSLEYPVAPISVPNELKKLETAASISLIFESLTDEYLLLIVFNWKLLTESYVAVTNLLSYNSWAFTVLICALT